MKSKFFLVMFVFLATNLMASPKLREGRTTVIGSGTDEILFYLNSAWFLGDHQIPYCLELGNDISLSEEDVLSQVNLALLQWKTYLSLKGVNKAIYERTGMENLQIGTNFVYQSKCDQDSKLIFKIGLDNQKIQEDIIKLGLNQPLAFAYRSQLDKTSEKTRGYIWIAGDGNQHQITWNHSLLKGVLLHEIGHIFGNEHVSGTIMSKEFLKNLKVVHSNPNKFQNFVSTIDQENELFLSKETTPLYQGILGGGKHEQQEIFELLVGRKPVGEISAFVKRLSYNNKTSVYSLVVSDQLEESKILIKEISNSRSYFRSDANIFRVSNLESGLVFAKQIVNLFSYALNRKDLGNLIVTINSSDSPLEIKSMNGVKMINLFKSNSIIFQ